MAMVYEVLCLSAAIALDYVDPAVRYPPGWMYDGKSEVRTAKVPFQETWKAMEALVDAGLVKAIGISNMTGSLLLDLLRYARIPPSVLQIGELPLCNARGLPLTVTLQSTTLTSSRRTS